MDFLLRSAAIGYAWTRKDVILIVERMLANRGESRELSGGWWNKCVLRYPEIGLRTPATRELGCLHGKQSILTLTSWRKSSKKVA